MLMLPMPITDGERDRERTRRQLLNRGLFHPRLWNMLHAPWKRWNASARLAMM